MTDKFWHLSSPSLGWTLCTEKTSYFQHSVDTKPVKLKKLVLFFSFYKTLEQNLTQILFECFVGYFWFFMVFLLDNVDPPTHFLGFENFQLQKSATTCRVHYMSTPKPFPPHNVNPNKTGNLLCIVFLFHTSQIQFSPT